MMWSSIHVLLIAGIVLTLPHLLAVAVSTRLSECDKKVHNFACHYYYNQLQDALISDKNELFWLQKTLFPEYLKPPETVKIVLEVTVGQISNQTCTRNDQLPAYYHDGAVWHGEWELTLSSSVLLVFVSEDVLFTFDNTVTWALHAMATGLGAPVADGSRIGIHIHRLPCTPSRDIVTETLIRLGSQLKAIAKHQGVPSSWDEDDKLEVVQVHVILKDGSRVLVYQPSELGNQLLTVAFVIVYLLGALFLFKIARDIYPKLWKDWIVHDKNNAYTLYWAATFVFLGLNIVETGVLVIAHLYRTPDLEQCYNDEEDCGSKYVVQVSGIKAALSTIILTAHIVIAFTVTKKCTKDNKSRIPLLVTWLCCGCFLLICKLRSCNGPHNALNRLGITKEWIVPALAVASNLVFFQQVTGSLIPSFILLLLYPELVISGLLFIISGIFCIIIFVAHILHTDRYRRKCIHTFLQALFVLLVLVLVGVMMAFYLLLLSHGIHAQGIIGFLLSLLPGVLLGIWGHFAKKFLLNTD